MLSTVQEQFHGSSFPSPPVQLHNYIIKFLMMSLIIHFIIPTHIWWKYILGVKRLWCCNCIMFLVFYRTKQFPFKSFLHSYRQKNTFALVWGEHNWFYINLCLMYRMTLSRKFLRHVGILFLWKIKCSWVMYKHSNVKIYCEIFKIFSELWLLL